MNSYLLASRREVVSTFRLMGIRGEWQPENGFERFQEIYRTGNYGLLFVGDGIISGYEREIQQLKATGKIMILVIPEQGGDFLGQVRSQIEQGLGMKV